MNSAYVQIKRTSVVGRVPSPCELAVGELAVNLADRTLYTKTESGEVIALCSGGPSAPVIGVISQPKASPLTSTMSFSVVAFATGGASLSYRWQKRAVAATVWESLADGASVSGSGTATLTLTGLTTPSGNVGTLFRVVLSATGAATITSNVAGITDPVRGV